LASIGDENAGRAPAPLEQGQRHAETPFYFNRPFRSIAPQRPSGPAKPGMAAPLVGWPLGGCGARGPFGKLEPHAGQPGPFSVFRSDRFVSLAMVGAFSPVNALTQQELIAKLEAAGYSQVREVKSTAEGIAVKAMKDGKEVSLVLDSSGQIKERH
jgi:hypothetical protein